MRKADVVLIPQPHPILPIVKQVATLLVPSIIPTTSLIVTPMVVLIVALVIVPTTSIVLVHIVVILVVTPN